MRTFTTIAIATALSLSSTSISAEVTFDYDKPTETLTFSGEGNMKVDTTDMFGDTYIHPAWSNLKENVKKVVINEGVTDVGKHAFMGFSALEEIKLASTIETIGTAAFEGCESLSNIQLPEGLKTIEEEAFYECKSLTSISIPKNVSTLPGYTFQGCSSLKSIDLGNVTELGEQVFAYCGFETFEIPENIKVLSKAMFFSCKQIKTIDIPAWVEEIQESAFNYCKLDTINFLGETFPAVTGLNHFTMAGGKTVFRINCKAYTAEAIESIQKSNYYNSKIIPDWQDGTEITSNDNSNGPLTITPVDCEKNLYKLSVDLWSPSYKVTWEGSYNVPESDLHKTEIIVDLTEPATITANIEYNGGSSSSNIMLFTDVIGKGEMDVTTLEESESSKTYKAIATPEEGFDFLYWETYPADLLTEEQKKSLEVEFTITQSSSINAIFTQSPYCGKDGGENITWSIKNDTLYLIGTGEMEEYSMWDYPPFAFTQNTVRYVSIAEGITTIGSMSFFEMEDIKEIYIPSTMTKIGNDAFTYCESLEKVHFAGSNPPSFTTMEELFSKDYSNERAKIVVPCDALEAYKEIFSTYQEFNRMTGEVGPKELQVVCDSDEPQPQDIPSIEDFTFDPANVCGAEGDGSNVLWSYDEATATLALKGTGLMKSYNTKRETPWKSLEIKNLIVSEGVTNIGGYAFMSKSNMENIYLPTTIESIEEYAFAEIDSVKKLILPEGVKHIGKRAFQNLTATKVVLPSTLEEIDEGAFQYCHFSRIEIPRSVTKIGKGAFYYVYELEEIVFENETPANTDGNTILSDVSIASGPLPKIVVPCDAVSSYKENPGYQAEYVQGDGFPYSLTIENRTENVNHNDNGGKAYIMQWPDCETGEAIAYVFVKSYYKFSHWEAEGITLTEEQAKADTIKFTVDADCILTAVYTEKESVGVDDIDADDIVVTISEGNISVNKEEFRILDALGRDVTSSNGHLTPGMYVVMCENKSYKTVLK